MDAANVWVAAAGLLLAGLIKGITGIGYSTCALPFLSVAVGLRNAMALVVAPAIASNVAVLFGGNEVRRVAARFWPFYASTVPGIALGTYLFSGIDADVATQILGALTLAYVMLALARPSMRMAPRLERPLALPAGFLNGVVTGTTGSQVMPLMPYFMALRLKPEEQVQAINLSVTLASVILGAAMLVAGVMSSELALASLVATAPAMAGVGAGNIVRPALSAATFRFLSLMMLTSIGTSLLLTPPSAIVDVVALVDRFDVNVLPEEAQRLIRSLLAFFQSSALAG